MEHDGKRRARSYPYESRLASSARWTEDDKSDGRETEEAHRDRVRRAGCWLLAEGNDQTRDCDSAHRTGEEGWQKRGKGQSSHKAVYMWKAQGGADCRTVVRPCAFSTNGEADTEDCRNKKERAAGKHDLQGSDDGDYVEVPTQSCSRKRLSRGGKGLFCLRHATQITYVRVLCIYLCSVVRRPRRPSRGSSHPFRNSLKGQMRRSVSTVLVLVADGPLLVSPSSTAAAVARPRAGADVRQMSFRQNDRSE
ncbi:hypothetical protein CMQ_7723 [Grosmannia clavigera kw1407]|uniref:Uncharacterized protein n=1 Tax=Grosmannia clavigera (strain kw1407 / UAMH 11150) TaxID=655863 RepID=F0XPU7_GROCL|nr:uncharacterized protein CMQ_7723 [Grosmannia clavigera kw1407]EFX00721.1 hypothetical protein CMQ_7723 [Grosmannia clavigera kw1407]